MLAGVKCQTLQDSCGSLWKDAEKDNVGLIHNFLIVVMNSNLIWKGHLQQRGFGLGATRYPYLRRRRTSTANASDNS